MFDLKKIIITNDDISFVEKQFGFRFNEGQINIIKYWESTDIQACPGSGKTTTLAAKLIILARKLPKSFKQGICIITHTNVAVEEIKIRLGSYANFYFNYPNHFGTIQSFVDKYISIPAYKNEFKQSPKIIDTESYCKEINKFQSLSGTSIFLSRKGIEEIGYLSFNINNFLVSKKINESYPFSVNGIAAEKLKVHYDKIEKVKLRLFKEFGLIKYDEAYSLAFKYLRENPSLKPVFSKRFSLVFIDEMQDMETHQADIVKLLFDNTSSIVQKIGDKNQSIFGYSSEEKAEWQPIINLNLQLTETARISHHIVEAVRDICVSPQVNMMGWLNSNPIKPTIIVYSNNNILKVKDKFGELLIHHNIHEDGIFKAVGARHSDSRLNINSYWPEFNRKSHKKYFNEIDTFLIHIKELANKSKNVKEIKDAFLDIVCYCLRIAKIKNPSSGFYFSPYTFNNYLSLTNTAFSKDLNTNLAKWILLASNSVLLKNSFREYILFLVALFGKVDNEDIKLFFQTQESQLQTTKKENLVYTYFQSGKEVQIHFDTIHGVKGETHLATLYLETYNRTYDIGSKILEFIISTDPKKVKQRKDDSIRKRLPLAYVVMTRATQFICLAVNIERFGKEYKEYFESNQSWNIVYL